MLPECTRGMGLNPPNNPEGWSVAAFISQGVSKLRFREMRPACLRPHNPRLRPRSVCKMGA